MMDWGLKLAKLEDSMSGITDVFKKHLGDSSVCSKEAFQCSALSLFTNPNQSLDSLGGLRDLLNGAANIYQINSSRKELAKMRVLSFILSELPAPSVDTFFDDSATTFIMAYLRSNHSYIIQNAFIENESLPRWFNVQSSAFIKKKHNLLESILTDFIPSLLKNNIQIIASEDEIIPVMTKIGWDSSSSTLRTMLANIKERFPEYDINQISKSELLCNAIDKGMYDLAREALNHIKWDSEVLNKALKAIGLRVVNYNHGRDRKAEIELLLKSGASPRHLTRPMIKGWLDVEGKAYMSKIKEMSDSQDRPYVIEALLIFHSQDNKGNLSKYLDKCPEWQRPLVIQAMGATF